MRNFFLLLLTAFLISCCSKDDNYRGNLPAETQTGAGTFACRVNGKLFIDNSGGYFNCSYQLIDGEYYFSISGYDDKIQPSNIYLGTIKKEILENNEYILLGPNIGNAGAGAGFSISQSNYQVSHTSTNYTGLLKITKLDFNSNIISGTFSFDIPHPVTGEIIQIRDGRFDTLFTQ